MLNANERAGNRRPIRGLQTVSGSSIHATNEAMPSTDDDVSSATLRETQMTSERMLVAIGNIERALDEKFKRDEQAKNTPDPAVALLNEEIAQLKSEIAKLSNENNQLHQAVNLAGSKLDNAIESLGAHLSQTN